MGKMSPNKLRIIFIIVLCLLWISCAGPNIVLQKDTVYDQTIDVGQGKYLLGSGDVIEIIYHIVPEPTEKEYILAVGDVIKVEFYYHPNMDRQLRIRPYGKITVPLKGDIVAAGLTPIELKEKIIQLFNDVFKDTAVTVTVVEYNVAIKELRDTIATSARGQSQITTIRPDGFVSFPLIGDIRASGLTITQLKTKVTTEYNEIIDNLSVSLLLQQIKSNLVYVMGEVRRQDYYLMDAPTTLMQILARAGGFLNTAKLDTVLIISRNKKGKPVGRLVNVKKILEEANIGHDILLKQYDVVYVPKTAIAKVNLFIDQYVNQLIPNIFRVNYTLSDNLDR